MSFLDGGDSVFGRVIASAFSRGEIDRLAQARALPIRTISFYQN